MLRYLLVFFTCISLISPNVHANSTTASCEGHQCIAVVDAGSTGSRLHIFSYDTDASNSPININEVWNKKIKPGLASIDANKNTIDAYMTALLADAPVKEIPLYFYATAGMRLLSAQKQQTYYQEIKAWFSAQSQWKLIQAKTITGNDEALYDWLSVNYQLGTFNSNTDRTIGVMDMGGASVQIVFPIKNTQQIQTNPQVEVDLYGKHYSLSVHSFLGLGQTEMSHQFLDSISCYSNNYPLPDGDSGHGNIQTCETEVSALMNAVHGVNNTMQPLLADNPVNSWYVIGGLSSLASTKPIQFDNNQLTLHQLVDQADSKLCQQPWDVLNTQYPNDEYIYQNCLSSAYYYALVVDGYGIDANQVINFLPPEQNIDWTKGVVLHKPA
ncbi:MAG: multidrug DMT transporter permease [Legionellales bacterium]